MENLICKSIDELKELLVNQKQNRELIEAALYWKERKLDSITNEELQNEIENLRNRHRYLRKVEDVVLTSCKENIRGFYDEWDSIEIQETALFFEYDRRQTLS